MTKKFIHSLLALLLTFSICSLTYGDQMKTTEVNQTEATEVNNDAPSLSVEEQIKLLTDYMSNTGKKRTFDNDDNKINLVGYNGYGFIEVGIANLEDEKFKNDILSIPGIDSKLVQFVEFIINPQQFATEPPPGYETARCGIWNGFGY